MAFSGAEMGRWYDQLMLTLIAVAVLAVDGGVALVPPPMPKPEPFSFRGLHWGDTKEAVQRVAGDVKWREPDQAMSYGQAVDLDVGFAWTFVNGGLAQIAILVLEKRHSSEEELGDYTDVLSALTTKYGEPTMRDDDGMKSSLHIAHGRSFRRASWTIGDVEIKVSVSGVKGRASTMLVYTDPRQQRNLTARFDEKRSRDL